VAQLVVNDGWLDSAADTVRVRTANRAPEADAGPDQSVAVGTIVTLDATASSDPDGDPLSFSWQFVSRPSGSSASLNAPALGLAAFTPDVSGRFVVRVTVTDSAGASSDDELAVDATHAARLDTPADVAWQPVQVGDSVDQDVVVTNSGGVAVTGIAATVSGDFAVDAQSPCFSGPLAPGDSCEIQVSFRPTGAGHRSGLMTVTSSVPAAQSVSLTGEGQLASLIVSPASLAFPSTLVGQSSSTEGVALTNDGIGDVELLNVGATGDFALDASAADRCQAGSVLTPGASCSLSASFAPTQPGTRTGSLVVDARGVGDTAVVTRAVSLSGDGVPPPVVSLALTDGLASEFGPDDGTITLTRTGSTSAHLSVSYSVSGAAAAGADYTALPGTATFAAGAAQVVLTVSPLTDGLNEGTESVTVTLVDAPQYDLGASVSGTVSIEDAYQEVSVVASDATASEVTLNTGAFTVTRLGSTSVPLTVNFAVGGTASPGADYMAIGSSIVIPSGQASVVVSVIPLTDGEDEPTETVSMVLGSGTYVVGTPAAAVVNLGDDPRPRISVIAFDAAASEVGPATGTFRFSRTGSTAQALGFRFTAGGSAQNDGATDFTPFLSGDLTFAAGSDTVDVIVTPIADGLPETDETVVVTLLDDAHYNLGASVTATVTISDPPVPVVSVTAFDPDAAEAGLEPGVFRFARTGDLSAALTVSFARSGSAINGTDYANIGGTATFNAGQATTDRLVVPINDALVEAAESVTVTLIDGASYDLGSSTSATVTIADQPVPTISLQVIDNQASEAGDQGLFRFTRSGDTSFSLQFTITRGGSATNSSDYSNISSTLTFAAGQATLDRALVPVNDALVEGTETVTLTIQDGANYDLGLPIAGSIDILDQAIPIVTITAFDPSASETGPDPGVFRFTRVGDTALPLTVGYTRAGTATTSDYASFALSIQFPAGQATVDRVVTPAADGVVEGSETVVLTLTDGLHYDLGASAVATVTITD
jgi:hypothetical protein